ncbi:MAG: hypothetical protein NTV80_21140 [Verrucomicrobia bacterium]|nr:hypothetical protein [Verrucomicrobiota bacterium]
MKVLCRILAIVFLISQAVGATWVGGEAAPKKCPMSCCAALVKAGLGECACEADSSGPAAPAPASLPPAQGREIMPPLVWVESLDSLIPVSAHADAGRALRPELAMQTVTKPHVRLTVLFCSFLT